MIKLSNAESALLQSKTRFENFFATPAVSCADSLSESLSNDFLRQNHIAQEAESHRCLDNRVPSSEA